MAPLALKFITGNANKLKEVASILSTGASAGSFELSNQNVEADEIQGTTREVAIAKVKGAALAVGSACITEVRHAPASLLEESAGRGRLKLMVNSDGRTQLSHLRRSTGCQGLTSRTS